MAMYWSRSRRAVTSTRASTTGWPSRVTVTLIACSPDDSAAWRGVTSTTRPAGLAEGVVAGGEIETRKAAAIQPAWPPGSFTFRQARPSTWRSGPARSSSVPSGNSARTCALVDGSARTLTLEPSALAIRTRSVGGEAGGGAACALGGGEAPTGGGWPLGGGEGVAGVDWPLASALSSRDETTRARPTVSPRPTTSGRPLTPTSRTQGPLRNRYRWATPCALARSTGFDRPTASSPSGGTPLDT